MTQPSRPGPQSLAGTLSAFADRLFRTGGRDPGEEALPIPEDRLAVYRDLVTANYRSMLSFAFPGTLRLVRAELRRDRAANGDTDRDAVVRRFLATAPARTHSTREIADRFLAFLPTAYPDIVARRPEIQDLMRVERAELRADYHSDDPGRGATPEDVAAMRARSVEEFLAVEAVRAPSGSLLRLAHPVFALRGELHAGRTPPSPSPAAEIVLVSRHPVSLSPTLRVLTDPGAGALEIFREGERARIESVAERWLATGPASGGAPLDEAAAFSAFGDSVLAAIECGFLRLA